MSFLQNLLNFIIIKHLEQEVDDDLSICVDKRSPCGLSMAGDISFNEVFLLFKFDVSSFSVTGDIKIFKLVILLTLGKSKLTLIVYFH